MPLHSHHHQPQLPLLSLLCISFLFIAFPLPSTAAAQSTTASLHDRLGDSDAVLHRRIEQLEAQLAASQSSNAESDGVYEQRQRVRSTAGSVRTSDAAAGVEWMSATRHDDSNSFRAIVARKRGVRTPKPPPAAKYRSAAA